MIDDSPPALCGLHTPLAAHPHRFSGVHSPLKRLPGCQNGSPDKDNTLVTVTESGYLRIELDTGIVICIGEDGVHDAASWNAPPRPLGMKWADVQVGPAIGKGGLATVYTAVHLHTQVEYALKVMRVEGAVVKNVVQQELAHVLWGPMHTNIVASHCVFYLDQQLHVLMDLMDGGCLKSLIHRKGPLPQKVVACIAKQVLLGLESLHTVGVVHRDLKPSNLLLHSQGVVKISDFGIAQCLHHTKKDQDMAWIGSHCYMSPERLFGEEYDTSSDIWSLGLCMVQAALGVFPFLNDDIMYDRHGNRRESGGSWRGRPSQGSHRSVSEGGPSATGPQQMQDAEKWGAHRWQGVDDRRTPDHFLPPSLAPGGQPRPAGHLLNTAISPPRDRTQAAQALSSPAVSLGSTGSGLSPQTRFCPNSPAIGNGLLGSPSGLSPPNKRDSTHTAVSSVCGSHYSSVCSSHGDGNPFAHEVSIFEFSLMLQDPDITVDFDRLLPLVAHWYPQWPVPEILKEFRDFISCCLQHQAKQRWTCVQLLQHPFILNHASDVDLKCWLSLHG
uniref:mitogen-activated protein kinase kinase n=1 Tax=Eutreptiella gymnastica TaxID=73025 RepID=A0A7S1JAP6_9EUGL|mmetsp:Transcript_79913/g.141083  ORF Transcript_79913/g.141083 Transcript_79913/m.141083 type:complete len:555 (+) Transcript_79913:61-1725(+)